MCPNLECMLPKPIIILCSFKTLMKGKWYRAASGRFIFAYSNNSVDNTAIIKLYLINFLLKNLLLSIKYKRIPKPIIIVFSRIFKGMKKFKKSAMNDKKIIPSNDIFSISFVCN